MILLLAFFYAADENRFIFLTTHSLYLSHMTSFNQLQFVHLPTKQERSERPLVYFAGDVNSECVHTPTRAVFMNVSAIRLTAL